MPKQIKYFRSVPEKSGSAFYGSKHFNRDLMGFQDSLKLNLYQKPAIVPPMKWIDDKDPSPIKKIKKSGRKVKWETVATFDEMEKPNLFVIYINEKGERFDSEQADFVLTPGNQSKIKLARINKKKRKYEIRISVLDRLKNESQTSKPVDVKL